MTGSARGGGERPSGPDRPGGGSGGGGRPSGGGGARRGGRGDRGSRPGAGRSSYDDIGEGGSRREARERAFHLLYEAEIKGVAPSTLLEGLPLRPDPFAVELVEGVAANRDEIDALISAHARNWELDRMPALDRAVLRLASYELSHRPDVPTGAAINEAVELATQYSTDDSGRFVNGVLSAIARQVRPA